MNEESMSYNSPIAEPSRNLGNTNRVTGRRNAILVDSDDTNDIPRMNRNENYDEGQQVSSGSELRGININPLSSGYMVKVGCQSVAVETTEKLVDMINKYLTDPSGFEKKWYSKDVRNRLENI